MKHVIKLVFPFLLGLLIFICVAYLPNQILILKLDNFISKALLNHVENNKIINVQDIESSFKVITFFFRFDSDCDESLIKSIYNLDKCNQIQKDELWNVFIFSSMFSRRDISNIIKMSSIKVPCYGLDSANTKLIESLLFGKSHFTIIINRTGKIIYCDAFQKKNNIQKEFERITSL